MPYLPSELVSLALVGRVMDWKKIEMLIHLTHCKQHVNVEGTSTTGEFAEVCPGDKHCHSRNFNKYFNTLGGGKVKKKKIK